MVIKLMVIITVISNNYENMVISKKLTNVAKLRSGTKTCDLTAALSIL